MSNDEILRHIGLENAPKERQEQVLEKIRGIVELRLMGLMQAALTDAELEEFDRLQQGPADNAWAWLGERLDLTAMYNAVLTDYVESFGEER